MSDHNPRTTLRTKVDGIVDSIKDGIANHEVYDNDSLIERIHDETDSSIIYYSDQWDICHYWDGDEDHLERFGATSLSGMIAEAAYQIVELEVWDRLRSEGVIDGRGPILPDEKDEDEDDENDDDDLA